MVGGNAGCDEGFFRVQHTVPVALLRPKSALAQHSLVPVVGRHRRLQTNILLGGTRHSRTRGNSCWVVFSDTKVGLRSIELSEPSWRLPQDLSATCGY